MSAHAAIPKVGTLVSVWATLIFLTGLTSAASYVDVGEWNIVLALVIAVTKASLVVWIFMGVRHVTTLTRLFVVAGLVWLFIMILITYSDYGTRHWTYQPKPWATNPAHGLSR
jgi:cytochrome c oxidase subunit IV